MKYLKYPLIILDVCIKIPFTILGILWGTISNAFETGVSMYRIWLYRQ